MSRKGTCLYPTISQGFREEQKLSNIINDKDTISCNINSSSHSPENIKACKALTEDCNCAKCYDSSGFYWGWKYQNISFTIRYDNVL